MHSDHPAAFTPNEFALVQLAHAARNLGYHFVTPSPATHERVNSRPGNAWANNLRDVLGWSRPFKPGVLPPEIIELMHQADLLAPTNGGWRCRLRLSSLNEQLLWHSAYPTTQTDAVFFGPDTYRFALAIHHHLQARKAPVARAFDIGCGTGAGALCVAQAQPDARVWAGDINDQALRLSRINAAIAGAGNVETCRSDMLSGALGRFDLIIANPPYLNDSLKRAYRHGGGSHGQELAVAMLRAALPRLAPGGELLLYTGTAIVNGRDAFLDGAMPVLQNLPASWSFQYQETDPDVFGEELNNPGYADAERIAATVLTVQAAH